jgi:hypothetical protein
MDLVQTCIAMATLYALLSVIASAMKETLEAAVQKRKQNFKAAVEELLGSEGAKEFLNHPRIRSMISKVGEVDASTSRHWPSYVDAETFAAVAQEIIQAYPEGQLARMANWGRAKAKDELALLQNAYAERMERLSGSFKRNAQAWLIAIGFGLAFSVDADTVQMARQMATDSAARAALVNLAGRVDSAEAVQALCPAQGTLQLVSCIEEQMPQVLGWSEKKRQAFMQATGWTWWFNLLVKLAGYAFTAMAISLGAPFWFDLIGKVANIRATSKPEKKA